VARRSRKRSCDIMTDSSSCARSSPARPQLGLFVRSLSIRRSAAATRSHARSQSAMVYCRGFGRVRFLRGAFAAILAPRMNPIASTTASEIANSSLMLLNTPIVRFGLPSTSFPRRLQSVSAQLVPGPPVQQESLGTMWVNRPCVTNLITTLRLRSCIINGELSRVTETVCATAPPTTSSIRTCRDALRRSAKAVWLLPTRRISLSILLSFLRDAFFGQPAKCGVAHTSLPICSSKVRHSDFVPLGATWHRNQNELGSQLPSGWFLRWR
jgi:hypothetical protein